MLKQISALAAAFTFIASVMAIPSSADEYFETNELSVNVLLYNDLFRGFMVETDGTELTEEMVSGLDGYLSLQTWEDFQVLGSAQHHETSVIPEGPAYMVSIDSSDEEMLISMSRKLLLEQDCVENVYVLDYAQYGYGFPEFALYAESVNDETMLEKDSIPELAEFEIDIPSNFVCYVLRDHKGTAFYEDYIASLEGQTDTGYRRCVYMQEFAEKILEKYDDILSDAYYSVDVLASGQKSEYTARSIWQTAGDPNADGAVDAKDAASILQTAAENGTGAGIAATSATDVNADGEVNAKDAAAVLVYAAEEGAGKTPDWVEILRR